MISNLSNNYISCAVKHSGAELCSIKSKSGLEFMWQAGHAWQRHAPILFPIVGRLKNDTFKYNRQSFTLTQHGFARDLDFDCVIDDGKIICTLTENNFTLVRYPFKFKLQIVYRLLTDGVNVSYIVQNTDDVLMPFSIGGHPAFNCPMQQDETFEDYEIVFDKPLQLNTAMLSNGLFDGRSKMLSDLSNTINLHTHIFDDDALVFENLDASSVTLKSKKTGSYVSMGLEGFPYLGIWSKPGAPFVCLEPWCGKADSVSANGNLFEKAGIETLQPQQIFTRSYDIKVSL